MEQRERFDLSSAGLHILAMGFMLCDHLWAMFFPDAEWLTCIGRLAYPIFAFLAAEGYAHTRDLRRYLLRLLFWALLSEIPFDLMYNGSVFYPFHQNVLWTLLIGLLLIRLIDGFRARFRPVPAALLSAGAVLLAYVLGYVSMADYFGGGVLTVLVFRLFRERGWRARLLQLLCLYIINVEWLGGYDMLVTLFGRTLEITQQGFALLALVPIWLYRGRQGHHSRAFRLFCYAFYPAHMLLLFAVWTLTRG